ncbi:MAG: hypothetical protein JSS98_05745 [Bacteroidetes bacterium]|nr:hypothetical protein [Bacteroidota bacterium]
MKNQVFYYILILNLVLLPYCSSKKDYKNIKKEYFANGRIKSYRKYKNDSIPIDTIFNFYENGNPRSILVYDTLGQPNGESKFFFENGILHQIINYRNGLMQDFFYEYNRNGRLISKIFFFNDYQAGDSYYFNNNTGIVSGYNFYDFSGHNMNSIRYDSLGKIIKDSRQRIFIDSMHSFNGATDKENEHSYNIYLLISNPPNSRTIVNIDYISRKNAIMKSDTILSTSYYFVNEKLPDTLSSINIFASQYDSINHKTIYQDFSNKLVFK